MRWRKLACSFCGKDADAVERLVAGPRVFICDGCVARCNEILGEHPPEVARSCSAIARPVNDRPWWQRVLGWWSARALEGVRGEVSGGG
jgi:hypothetical protein